MLVVIKWKILAMYVSVAWFTFFKVYVYRADIVKIIFCICKYLTILNFVLYYNNQITYTTSCCRNIAKNVFFDLF